MVNRSGPAGAAGNGSAQFAALNALRGVAALAVVFYHFSSRLDLPELFAHGYLAVDFFFVLSGFVIEKAYGARVAGGAMPILRFYGTRIIRLFPMVIVGTAIAAVIELYRPGSATEARHLPDTILALVTGMLLIPTLWSTTLEQVIFPLNGAMWSLFFEAVANAGFAPLRKWFGGSALPPLLAISGAGMVYSCMAFDTANVGFFTSNFLLGFFRVAWSFGLGIALYRYRALAPRIPFSVCVAVLVAILASPEFGRWNVWFDAACVLVVLPAIVFAASTVQLGRRGSSWSDAAGQLSYPLYAVHYSLVRSIGFVGLKMHLSLAGRLGVATAGTIAIIVFSALVYVLCDKPVRALLMAGFRSPRSWAAPVAGRGG